MNKLQKSLVLSGAATPSCGASLDAHFKLNQNELIQKKKSGAPSGAATPDAKLK